MIEPNRADNLPFVSVVMPVRDEADFIEKSLGAVLAQNYPPELLEIIIADGFSTDETRAIIASLAEKSAVPVKLIDNPKKIAPGGLNLAIRESRGEIIVRVDGHCEIRADYVANCVKHLTAGKAAGVGGKIETIGANTVSEAIAEAMSSKFGVGGSAFRCAETDAEIYVDTVAFPGYKREIFNRAGLFNEELVRNQDDEFNYRVRKQGGKILLAPDIHSKYYSRSSFKSLWRQYFQYGFWKVRVLQLHPKQMSARQFVPFLFVSSLLSLMISGIFSIWGIRLAFLIFLFYLLAAGFAAGRISFRRKIKLFPFVLLSFCILHFSYGFGFAAGLLAFRQHRRGENAEIPLKPIV